MTLAKLENYFRSGNVMARVIEHRAQWLVSIRVHPYLLAVVKGDLELMKPITVEYDIKPLRWWDYWLLRKCYIKIESRKK